MKHAVIVGVIVLLVLLVVKFISDVAYLSAEADLAAKCGSPDSEVEQFVADAAAVEQHHEALGYAAATPPRPPASVKPAASSDGDAPTAGLVAPSQCPKDIEWMQRWAEEVIVRGAAPRRNVTLVNVGANKGFTIALWVRLLSNVATTVFRDLATMAVLNGVRQFCGNCCDCLEELLSPELFSNVTAHIRAAAGGPGASAAIPQVNIVGFEGLPKNSRVLQQYFARVKLGNVAVKIEPMAVSNSTGTVQFIQQSVGSENGRIARNTRSDSAIKKVTVGTTSLDAYFLGANRTTHVLDDAAAKIDVLLTDTEGFDAVVFSGAKQLLRERRVSLYMFEMVASHDANTAMLEELDRDFGFTCYFPSQRMAKARTDLALFVPYLVRAGSAAAPKRISGWINALCVRREEQELLKRIDALTLLNTDVLPAGYLTCPAHDALWPGWMAGGSDAAARRSHRKKAVLAYFSSAAKNSTLLAHKIRDEKVGERVRQ